MLNKVYQGDEYVSAELIAAWVERVAEVPLERYATAEAVFRHYWQGAAEAAGVALEAGDLLEGESDGGAVVQFTEADALEGIAAAGCWGFCDTNRTPAVIHYWRADDCDPETFRIFAAHELSHAIVERLLAEYDGKPNEEVLAEVVSAVAARAARLAEGKGEPAPGFVESGAE